MRVPAKILGEAVWRAPRGIDLAIEALFDPPDPLNGRVNGE